jgi:hypothetical protein
MHGGSAPQVKAAAQRRLLEAADPVAARLVKIALAAKTEVKDALIAIREVLNRAGIIAETTTGASAGDGMMLWDEFVQVYRRKAGHASDD